MNLEIYKDTNGNLFYPLGKDIMLEADGAYETNDEFQKNLICVLTNYIVEEALYIPTKEDFDEIKLDHRVKNWFIHPNIKELIKKNPK